MNLIDDAQQTSTKSTTASIFTRELLADNWHKDKLESNNNKRY